jgi:cobyrinic acid a,c-diamide synthase
MRIPRIMIAAPMSGCGKTTIVCGLMQALMSRGYKIAGAKCGPDYIDPMFHRKILGVESENLDLFFCEPQVMRGLFAEHASEADITLIEGVMGYYDGMAIDSEKGSSYEVAKVLDAPVLLVIDAKGAALSVLAVLKGFLTFRDDNNIAGILLNRVSGAVYPRMKEMVEQGLEDMGHPVPVVGYVPENPLFRLKSRHLGLVTPQEIKNLKSVFEEIGTVLSETVDLEQILKIAGRVPLLEPSAGEVSLKRQIMPPERAEHGKIRLAVARDLAFGFYYKDNLRLLEKLGCELAPFSPLKDRGLPPDISGLLLGGGYPELYAEELSANTSLIKEIRTMLEQGLPCHAECGGFMYLHEAMEGSDHKFYDMVGFIGGKAIQRERLVRFGYIQIEGNRDGVYLEQGEVLRGHEFHYWDSQNNGDDCVARKPGRDISWNCIHMRGNVFAGFPHIHYYSNMRFAQRFVNRMKEYLPDRCE